MVPIKEGPNTILKSQFVNIQAFDLSLKKGKDWQQHTNSDSRATLML